MTKTKKITLSAILVAMATVLAMISKIIPAPWLQGGSVTIASMVPIILVSIIIDCRWGVLAAIVYSLIQMLTGFYPPPTQTFFNFFLVIFLDYIAAFGFLGFAGAVYRATGCKKWSAPLAGITVTAARYVSHILSGILIWGVYAEEGQSVLAYSLIYNGTYMIPEIIITAIVLTALTPIFKKIK
ncbi:MAG: energy-coupled thiamine transporter ThiT [Ruminococcaceae bacterium]|nr:energy-coupled thiamine transporter ThiT [Oscillospiraceae bacterium]